MPTLIFDCDGVLADTERDGHLPAFNQTFADVGLDIRWTAEEYGEKLLIGGGKERMASLLTPAVVARNGLPTDAEEQKAMLADWHKRKTGHYKERVLAGQLPARPGIARIATEAIAADWRLAVASTSAEESVLAVLVHAVGAVNADRFEVFAGDIVEHKKPAPDIYLLAIDRMGTDPAQALAIEDSRNGLLAAVDAGLRCLVTVSGYTADEDHGEAVLVVSSLGDPGGEAIRVLANRTPTDPAPYVSLGDLERCLAVPLPERRRA